MANQATNRECEICDNMALCYYQNSMWICNPCWLSEQKAKIELHALNSASRIESNPIQIPSNGIAPLQINSVLKESANIDSSVQVRTDIFNLKTKAINELKSAIEADDSITNKPYALAEIIKTRYVHLKKVMFEMNQEMVDMGNEQKAIQVYLNTLANSLKAEEREKLRIQDINYQPVQQVKKVKSITTTSTGSKKKTKFDKKELHAAAKETGISEFTIQTVAAAKGCTVAEAVLFIKASIQTAKS